MNYIFAIVIGLLLGIISILNKENKKVREELKKLHKRYNILEDDEK